MYRRELMMWEFEMARSGGLDSSSRLQKTYWLTQLKDQLHAWPDLRHEFEQLLADVPTLKGML
jgi:predicted ester cyclase